MSDIYQGPFNQHVDMSAAVKIPCPVCAAHYYGVCGLCGGSGVALRLPSGALFPAKLEEK